MNIQVIATDRAPRAIGPYSQAVVAGGFVHCSGQIALDPASGELVGADAAGQARQALTNLEQVLRAAGAGLDRVVRMTLFLTNLDDFGAVNAVFAEFFGDHRPARATVQVARLPRGAMVEIEATAAAA
jgi:2-iminobutanoate/2-iminopropanoate deaminase